MPNFVKTAAPSPRFAGDFIITPNAGYAPVPVEQVYLDAVVAALDQLAADEAADIAARYPERLFLDRRTVRNSAAVAFDADAGRFIGGQNAVGDVTRLNAILTNYVSALPKFGAKSAALPRFEGDFETVIVQGYVPGADEQQFLDNVEAARNEMAVDKRGDATGGFSPAAVKVREGLRQIIAGELSAQVENFLLKASPKAAAEEAVLTRGRYQARRERLTRRLFNVTLTSEPKTATDDVGIDHILDIKMLGGLPAPQDIPSAEKMALYIDIRKALTVVTTLCERLDERAQRGIRASVFGPRTDQQKRARSLEAEFLAKLYDVALIGLELEFTPMAKLTLEEIRREFYVREADRIKSIYVRQLGVWAGATALLLTAIYVSIYTGDFVSPWASSHKSFLLAASGAAIGAWTSFSARQVQFTFDDLVMVEEGSLDPPMRIIFVIVLTMAACLLFWNGAVNLEIGNLKTQSEPFRQSGSVAFLIGLFCGLSERALATAIAGRAAAFVKGIAGAT